MWGDIVIAFLLAFITAFVITPYTIRLAKKLGAEDDPKDERRINKVVMPRLRRTSSNFRIHSINNILIINNEYRRYNKSNGRGTILFKTNRIFYWNNNTWNYMLYR